MTRKPVLFATAAVILTMAGIGAVAQPRDVVVRRGPPADFATLDDNKDGKVSREEFRRPPADPFDAMDSDHDGTISKAEFDAMTPDDMDVVRFHGGPGGPGALPLPPHPRLEGRGLERREIRLIGGPQDLDADKDGKVTFEEFSEPMKRHFQDMDANKDGSLSSDELKQRPGTARTGR